MPNITERPYAGTWKPNNQLLVKYTPDCLVFVNGDLSIPGCRTEHGMINIQPFIKGVSVDTSTEPGGHSGNIQMTVPRVYGDSLFRDGRSVLRPGLEIHIYMRGYFPVKGLYDHLPDDQTELPDMYSSGSAEVKYRPGITSIKGLPTYPYYHVFHGVVTQVNYNYADGFYQSTLAVASMLHFWQHQVISTHGSWFGAKPENSNIKTSLLGHNLTGMTPYGIIYMLYKDTAGAAAGVSYAMDDKTNKDAVSQITGRGLWSMTLLYWEKRFRQTMYSLRMHGTNGRLFNGAQQAYLGSVKARDLERRIRASQYNDTTRLWASNDPLAPLAARAAKKGMAEAIEERIVGQVGFPKLGYDVHFAEQQSEDNPLSVNIMAHHAYVSDISNWGNINLWESQYETKLDIANKVREVTGFEFYQDVDGDLVFKPPFYNMDTSKSRVYRIEDIDIISIDFMEKEPNATAVVMKGSQFVNLAGTGTDNEMGVRGEYVDYRLVAQFGWRHHNMDISYFNDARSMQYAAINKLDLLNIDTNSAQCTIPIRPEIRPGYPVYIPFIDSFYYVTAFSHSYQVGGQCTTALTLTARRSKFYAPGEPEKRGIEKIHLDQPHLPATPLQVLDGGLPRLAGFPNCVMAIDPTMTNPKFSILGGMTFADATRDNLAVFKNLLKEVSLAESGILSYDNNSMEAYRAMFTGDTDVSSWWRYRTDDEVGETVRLSMEQIESEFDSTFAEIQKQRDIISDAQEYIAKERMSGKNEFSLVAFHNTIANARDKLVSLWEDPSNIVNVLITYYNRKLRVGDPQSRFLDGIDDSPSTAAYLGFLSDMKSNLSLTTIPGYYRYYSSSHPSPDHQGMRRMRMADRTSSSDAVEFGDGEITRLSDPRKVMGFVQSPDGGDSTAGLVGPEATLGIVKVVNGITLYQPRGVVPRAVPTHQIETISYAAALMEKAIAFLVERQDTNISSISKSFRGSVKKSLHEWINKEVVVRVENLGGFTLFSTQPFRDNFCAVFDMINSELNTPPTTGVSESTVTEFIDNQGVTRSLSEITLGYNGNSLSERVDLPKMSQHRGGSPVYGVLINSQSTPKRLSEINLLEAVGLVTRASKSHRDETIKGKRFFRFRIKNAGKRLKGKREERRYEEATSKVAEYYAGVLTDAIVDRVSYWSDSVRGSSEDDITKVSSYIVGRLSVICESLFLVGKGGVLGVNKKARKKIRRLTSLHTPVFPVSDSNGYEVFGSYRYGRGIGVESGGLMQAIYEQGNTMLDPFGGRNAETAELFLQALREPDVQEYAEKLLEDIRKNMSNKTSGLSAAECEKLGQIAVTQAATLAVIDYWGKRAGVNEDMARILNDIVPGSGNVATYDIPHVIDTMAEELFALQMANSIATNRDDVFKLPVVNAAYLLRDLDATHPSRHGAQPTCRGAEADLLLEAYGRTDFISVSEVENGSEPVAFHQEIVIREAPGYLASQRALRGQILDAGRPDLAVYEAFKRLKLSRDGFVRNVRSARDAITGQWSDVKEAKDRFKELRRYRDIKKASDLSDYSRI